ncbi:uncharacterized protein H6S33_011177 [Morchella sextelata]|uniref:uncharacterized protein n=1 Tax=Morchella sextelata TaxID=1174677 RepID=UPI001D046E71|nr:uncharacterized protein H6S33_011177 [Morchella sextelata]KAH0610750.1 hypothetical protein H6S33_011177 [Morchella sextelata]
MIYSTVFLSALLAAVVAAAPGIDPLQYRNSEYYKPEYYKPEYRPEYKPQEYYKPHDYYKNYYPNSNSYQNYYPYIKPNFVNAYEKQQAYDSNAQAYENGNENANAMESLAGAKSENANENANLAKGGEAFGFGALESDNRNLLANENNIEVANANKNELGVEVANFNANDNTAQQESAALAEVQSEDLAFFEDVIENETDNLNANENVNDNIDRNNRGRPCARPSCPTPCNSCGH